LEDRDSVVARIQGEVSRARATLEKVEERLEDEELDWGLVTELLYVIQMQAFRAAGLANRVYQNVLLEKYGPVDVDIDDGEGC